MAGLCWMTVGLALLLSAGNSLAAVDQTWLTSIIEGIKDQYPLGNTFSLAVNIPENQELDSLQEVLKDDSADKVKQAVSQGQVYQGSRVVAAAQPEALSQVLENMQPLIKSSQGNFLIIYSEESPCGSTCTNTNEGSIATKINDVTENWSGYAFVFSKVAAGPDADMSQLAQSFKQLTISKLGLENVFRCYQPGDDAFQCISCSSGGDVTPSCLANTSPSNQEQSEDEETGETKAADVGKQVALSTGEEIGTGIGTGLSEEIGTGKGKVQRGRKGMRKGKGQKRGKRRRGGRRKGGKVRKGRKRRGKGKVRRGRKGMRKGKGQRWGKRRRGGKRRGGSKLGGWGKRRRGSKRRGGSRRGGWGRRRGGSRRRWGE
ncbi:uncharacterized protein [Channa argus]|uniref:uncharacterized protein n=1 Tax=Channa argus TaxID=215402 RepID=UPI0029477A6F|nr:hypothetical protein Q8A73_002849 [Channa argus]